MGTFDWYIWVILPLIVFFARFVDVTLGTLRIIFLSRGKKLLAPLLGFVEVFIWITVVSQIVGSAQNNYITYFAYAAGFAVGNYFGMLIEEKLAIGTLVIRIILPKKKNSLINRLHEDGYGVTYADAHGGSGPVILVYTIVMRKEFEQVVNIIEETAPKAFYTVEELRSVRQGIFPVRPQRMQGSLFGRKKK